MSQIGDIFPSSPELPTASAASNVPEDVDMSIEGEFIVFRQFDTI